MTVHALSIGTYGIWLTIWCFEHIARLSQIICVLTQRAGKAASLCYSNIDNEPDSHDAEWGQVKRVWEEQPFQHGDMS